MLRRWFLSCRVMEWYQHHKEKAKTLSSECVVKCQQDVLTDRKGVQFPPLVELPHHPLSVGGEPQLAIEDGAYSSTVSTREPWITVVTTAGSSLRLLEKVTTISLVLLTFSSRREESQHSTSCCRAGPWCREGPDRRLTVLVHCHVQSSITSIC